MKRFGSLALFLFLVMSKASARQESVGVCDYVLTGTSPLAAGDVVQQINDSTSVFADPNQDGKFIVCADPVTMIVADGAEGSLNLGDVQTPGGIPFELRGFSKNQPLLILIGNANFKMPSYVASKLSNAQVISNNQGIAVRGNDLSLADVNIVAPYGRALMITPKDDAQIYIADLAAHSKYGVVIQYSGTDPSSYPTVNTVQVHLTLSDAGSPALSLYNVKGDFLATDFRSAAPKGTNPVACSLHQSIVDFNDLKVFESPATAGFDAGFELFDSEMTLRLSVVQAETGIRLFGTSHIASMFSVTLASLQNQGTNHGAGIQMLNSAPVTEVIGSMDTVILKSTQKTQNWYGIRLPTGSSIPVGVIGQTKNLTIDSSAGSSTTSFNVSLDKFNKKVPNQTNTVLIK